MSAKKRTTVQRKGISTSSGRGPVRHKRPGFFVRLLQRMPRSAFWLGGALIIAGYLCFFYYFFVSPYGFRWRALYGDMSVPEGYEIHGIDVSHYQGNIDWEKLRNDGMIEESPVSFVIIKATEGSNRIDPKFIRNFRQAHRYGFLRGAYHFYSVHSPAESQADFFIGKVALERGDLPPVLDVEQKPKDQTDKEFQQSILLWLNKVEQHYGVKPIIYTYYKFKLRYLSDEVFDQYPYWIAHYYVDSVEYKGQWRFWQHTDVGKLPGIKGYVDFNIYNGSYYDLLQLTIGGEAYRDLD